MSIIDLMRPVPGLRVLVSGAASGIGAAIADAFLQADAKVYVCDIDPSAVQTAKARNPRLHVGVADVSSQDQVDRIVEDAHDRLGGLDILVNNAGIAGPTGAVEAIEPDQWQHTISTNLDSQYYFLRKGFPC